MSKKLLLSGLAIAMALPVAAFADDTGVKFSGIVQMRQYLSYDHGNDVSSKDNSGNVHGGDVRFLISAEEKVGDYTGYATYRLDSENVTFENLDTNNDGDDDTYGNDARSGSLLTSDSVKVGFKGAFGDIGLGDASDVEYGEYANDIHDEGETKSEGAWNYKGSFSGLNINALWSPENNDDRVGLGLEYSTDIVTVGASFGTEGGLNGQDIDRRILGAKTTFNGITLAAHAFNLDVNKSTDEVEGTAFKVSGKVAAWSWGLTIADKEHDTANKVDDETVTRLDFGTELAGVKIGIRYNETDYDDSTIEDEDWLRLQLSKSF